jgi:hypothetical protein
MMTVQGQQARSPRLRRPVGHDQHASWPLHGELANDIWEESPGQIQPHDFCPSVECESI